MDAVQFYKEKEFKDTEIGKIPKDWEVVRLGDVADIKGRIGWHGLRDEDYLDSGDYYLVRGIDFENGKIAWDRCVCVSREWYERDPNIQLKEGDILITKDGTIGKVALVDFLPKKATLGTGIFRIRLRRENMSSKYVYYVLTSNYFKRFMQILKAGSTLSHLYQKDIINFEFPLPPLEEQRKIAEILSTIDKAIQKTNEIIAKTERLKKGLMQELLTKGLGHKEFKDTEIGKIPKDWEVVRLGDVTEIRKNKTVSDVEKVAFIPMELISDSSIYVNYEIRSLKEIRSSSYCEAGDLLLAKITPCFENGKQGIVPDDIPNGFALATTEVFPINCKQINRLFLFYVLKHPKFRKILEYSMRGTTGRQRVPKEAVENLLIPLPPLEEQKKIAQILSTVDKKLEIEKKEKEKLERIKRGFMDLLLTGKVRVCL